MPAKFDRMRKAIKDSLRKAYPNRSEEWYENTSYAVAVKRWKQKYGTSPFK